MDMPKIGQMAPDFTLPDQNGVSHTLSQTRGEWVLLYFYPKDDSPGCTKEACTLGEAIPRFQKLKAKVFGVSTDSVASHKKFAQKYGLTFPLLADEKKEVVQMYGVYGNKKFMGREYQGTLRTSFLINSQGRIEKVYENVKPDLHAEEVLADLKDK